MSLTSETEQGILTRTKDELAKQKDLLVESFAQKSLDMAKSSANTVFSKCPIYTARPFSHILPA